MEVRTLAFPEAVCQAHVQEDDEEVTAAVCVESDLSNGEYDLLYHNIMYFHSF